MRAAVLAAMTLVAMACTGKQAVPGPVPPSPDSIVVGPPEVDSGTYFLFSLLQARLRGHSKFEDSEYALCLYGTRHPLRVDYVRGPVIVQATDSTFAMRPCPASSDFLGVWHTHFPGEWGGYAYRDACWFSDLDKEYQDVKVGYPLALVTCGEGAEQKTIYRIFNKRT